MGEGRGSVREGRGSGGRRRGSVSVLASLPHPSAVSGTEAVSVLWCCRAGERRGGAISAQNLGQHY